MAVNDLASSLGLPLWAFVIVLTWILIWKALALWKSARMNQPVWFILLFVINTFGIFEILYLFLFSKINIDKELKEKTKDKKKTKRKK